MSGDAEYKVYFQRLDILRLQLKKTFFAHSVNYACFALSCTAELSFFLESWKSVESCLHVGPV